MKALAKILEAQRHLNEAAALLVDDGYAFQVLTELTAAQELIDHARKLREETK